MKSCSTARGRYCIIYPSHTWLSLERMCQPFPYGYLWNGRTSCCTVMDHFESNCKVNIYIIFPSQQQQQQLKQQKQQEQHEAPQRRRQWRQELQELQRSNTGVPTAASSTAAEGATATATATEMDPLPLPIVCGQGFRGFFRARPPQHYTLNIVECWQIR